MAGEKTYVANEGALYIQSTPGAKPEYLGCYDLDDISIDEGGISLIQCFDVNGQCATRGFKQDAPSPITTTLTTWLGKTAEFIEDARCPFILHVNMRCGGRADIFTNWQRAIALQVARKTNRTLSGLVKRNAQDEAEQKFDISALPPLFDFYRLLALRQGITETNAVNGIFFLDEERCASDCGAAVALGSLGIAVTDHAPGSASSANVQITTDGGDTWAAAAADPFSVSEHAAFGVGFYVGENTIRWLVGRLTVDAGNPAEIAYSDDSGVSWTSVNVGSTNGQFFEGQGSIYVAGPNDIWAVTDGGFIYKSDNGGLTWTVQSPGDITVQALWGVAFAPGSRLNGYVVGAANAMARTIDGGITWSLLTGPAAEAAVVARTLAVVDSNTLFVGYADGTLYRSNDAGATWTQQSFTGTGLGSVQAIMFVNLLTGFMIHNTAGVVGTVFYTRDGGYTWEALQTATNSGLNSVAAVKGNLAFVGGEVNAGSPVVLKVS